MQCVERKYDERKLINIVFLVYNGYLLICKATDDNPRLSLVLNLTVFEVSKKLCSFVSSDTAPFKLEVALGHDPGIYSLL